ncbi:3-oxoacyl-ACP reductase FabG [Oceanococcus atlanticus]|uniref:3-oxoacyl-ACP reductase FabG n=1 Tax=Oceanococcus atlanticus TaxID=1317117 RepID=UPI0009F9381B|nr:3-oxoacyl-ACP reductase FabG [Oceanococcus atlanticus]
MSSLSGKTALVTGASRGIGQAIAERLAHQGAVVIGTATSDAGAKAIATHLQAINPACTGHALNVTDADACKALIDELGSPDILINNAAITRDTLLLRMKDADFDDVIATNLASVARMSRLVLKGMMKKRWGRIISISSVVGFSGNPGQTNYAAAKAGVVGFSKALAREVASRNITVNLVAPGFIDTDMTKSLPDDVKTGLLEQIPLGRLGAAADVAAAVSFLASDDAAYVTGQTLHVNGGMLMP